MDFAKQVIGLTRASQQHQTDIAELRAGLKEANARIDDVASQVHLLALELRHTRETVAHEHEKFLLRIELALLKGAKQLPPHELDGQQSA